MIQLPIDYETASEIASLFFDRQDIKKHPFIGRLNRLFGTHTTPETENRFPSVAQASALMHLKGYSWDEIRYSRALLDAFVTSRLQDLMRQRVLAVGSMIEQQMERSDKHYLGMAGIRPKIDLREEAEFIAETKPLFSQLLIRSLSPLLQPVSTPARTAP